MRLATRSDTAVGATIPSASDTLRGGGFGERDSSEARRGFAVFSDGAIGQAHVMAHRMLDAECFELGQERLGEWLSTNDGRGSEWTHIHWHMAIFDLKLGEWDAAHSRFEERILPVAAGSTDALTDAPSLLWWLSVRADRPTRLPWEPVRETAQRALGGMIEPYAALHCILALAGAGDVGAIDRWLEASPRAASRAAETLLVRMGHGLRAYAAADYGLAATALSETVGRVWQLGGSPAQNQLFAAISDQADRLAAATRREAA